LKSAGYETAAFISSFVLEAQFGLDQGFDRYQGLTRSGQGAQSGMMEERPAAATAALALEWLKSAREPFFAWIHFYDPHHPYAPPAPVEAFRSRFAGREYEGEIASADAEVGHLLAALDQRSLRGRTYVAVTADHGEGLGDHGEMTHGYFLYNSTAHVPLII